MKTKILVKCRRLHSKKYRYDYEFQLIFLFFTFNLAHCHDVPALIDGGGGGEAVRVQRLHKRKLLHG